MQEYGIKREIVLWVIYEHMYIHLAYYIIYVSNGHFLPVHYATANRQNSDAIGDSEM
jgi:hypothetical protein